MNLVSNGEENDGIRIHNLMGDIFIGSIDKWGQADGSIDKWGQADYYIDNSY